MTAVVFRVRSGTPGNFGAWSAARLAFDVGEAKAGVALRVVTLDLGLPETATVSITAQPSHGHATANPDNTLAVVLADHTETIDVDISVAMPGVAARSYTVQVTATESPVVTGWGTGANFYMLPVDGSDRVTVEHGDNHRKVYIAPGGLTAAQIATAESVSTGAVTGAWLRDNHPDYGATEGQPLHPDIGFALWEAISPRPSARSNWLLLQRGGTYAPVQIFHREASGESALHPMYIGAWGSGAMPVITSRFSISGGVSRHIVVQDIDFAQGVAALDQHNNILFDCCKLRGDETVIQGIGGQMSGVTVRNTAILDCWRTVVFDDDEDGFWDTLAGRKSGAYFEAVTGLLVEGVFLDHNGWAPDFASDASTSGGHPPSGFNHNIYGQYSTRDVTCRKTITMRAASVGSQFRSGAFIEDTIFLDNNIAFNVNGGTYQESPYNGNFSLVSGCVVTSAAMRGVGLPDIFATDWGMRNEAPLSGLVGNIVCHANDPDNAGETWAGSSAVFSLLTPAFDDTITYRWGGNANLGSLNTATLDTTTIQRYTATLLEQPTATIADLSTHLRTLAPTEYKGAVADILAYFRTGFGLAGTPRAVAATLRFVPDARGDGVRWDNRLNWSTGDLPGTVSGDGVNLGGNKVVFGGTVTLASVAFGAFGGLTVNHGRLTGALTGATGATLNIGNAGQVWAAGATGAITTTITGGRLANTGAWLATGNLTVSGGQVILATGGATFTLAGRLDISGAAKVGFDGSSGTAALVMQSGATLGFVSTASALPMLGEFRSGAFGAAPSVASAVALAGTLAVTVTDLVGNGAFTLIDVDTLTGTLANATVTGLGSRDAVVAVDRAAGTVTLTLTAGTGEITLTHTG